MTNYAVIQDAPDILEPAARPRVLLVDPDDDVRAATAAVLQFSGMIVSQVGSAAGALSVMGGRWAATVVVTEFRLEPGEHGLTLMRAIHQMHPRVAVIVYTASTMPTLAYARRSGAYDLVTKNQHPIDRLIERVNSAHASSSPPAAE